MFTLKKIVVTILCLSLTLAAFGADQKIIKFAVWGLQEKSTQPYFEQIKSSFEKANPTISIEWVSLPYAQIKDQILIQSSAGEVPDLAQIDKNSFTAMVGSGFFAPIDSVMPAAYVKDIFPNLRAALTVNNKLWAAPWIYSPYVLYYNKDLFTKAGLNPAKPPKTYEEAMTMGTKLSALKDQDGNAIYGFGFTTASVPVSGSFLVSMLASFGGSLWDAAGNPAANTDKTVAMLTYVKSAYEKKLTPGAAKLKDLRSLFGMGRLAMYLDQTWGINAAFLANPAAKDFTAVAMPLGGNGAPAASTLEAHLLMVGVDSQVKPEVAKLIEFITSADQLKQYQAINPFLLARNSVNASPALQDPFMKPLAKAASVIKVTPALVKSDDQLLAFTTAAQSVTLATATEPKAAAAELDRVLKNIVK